MMEQPSKKTPGDLRYMPKLSRIEYLSIPKVKKHFGFIPWMPFKSKIKGLSDDAALELDMKIVDIRKKNKGW